MTRLFKHLLDDNQLLIREFTSDKVGIHQTAALIKTLEFDVRDDCTQVHATMGHFFFTRRGLSFWGDSLTFQHCPFDAT